MDIFKNRVTKKIKVMMMMMMMMMMMILNFQVIWILLSVIIFYL